MASTNKTAKGLNLWAENDKPTREDFVKDNQLIDEKAMWAAEYDADGAVKGAGGIGKYVKGQAVVTGNTIAAGTMAPFAGPNAPAGWLLCQGQAVSRTTYAALFAVIGNGYGNGDGSTTFNVPNMVGRMPLGAGGAYGRTSMGGRAAVDANALPTHSHYIPSLNGTAHGNGGHTHSYMTSWPNIARSGDKNEGKILAGDLYNQWKGNDEAVYPISGGDHTHSVATNPTHTGNVGSAPAMEILNPYVAVNYIIKC